MDGLIKILIYGMLLLLTLGFGIWVLSLNFKIYESGIKFYFLHAYNPGKSIQLRIENLIISIFCSYILLLYIMLQFWVIQRFITPLKPIYKQYRRFVFSPFIWAFNKAGQSLNIGSFQKSKSSSTAEKAITLKTTNKDVVIPNPFRGIFVVGGAGSGKTESFAIPLIREFSKQNFTGLIYDFKFPTLAQEVEDYYHEEKSEIKRYYLNLANPLRTHRVNPLNPVYMTHSAYAREYASAITKNLMKESIRKEDFWSRSATDLLTAVIWYLKQEHPQYCDLPHVLALIASPYKDLIKLLAENTEVRTMIISLVTAVESQASEQIAGVVGSLQGAVAQINTPEFMYILGGDDFHLGVNDPNHRSVVTVGSNPTIAGTIAPLCSLIISVSSKMMNQPGKEKSFIMLDESPTVFIPNIEVIPNTGRSNKIATVLFVQDLSQLIDGYGKEKADVLFASCANHFYGKVSSSHTADLLGKQFGKQDRYFESQSVNRKTGNLFQKNMGKSYSVQQREIFQGSDFMNLPVGQFIGNVAEIQEPYIVRQYMPSKNGTTIDLSSVIPSRSNNEIKDYYKRVSEEAKLILKGKAGFYESQVNKKQLIKPIREEETEQEEETPMTSPVEQPETISKNQDQSRINELLKSLQDNSDL